MALALAAPSNAAAAVTTYPDFGSFLAALGATTPTHENFDGFEPGTLVTSQVPGVYFSSPNSSMEGFFPIQIDASTAASSRPNMLVGGSVPGTTSEITQVM